MKRPVKGLAHACFRVRDLDAALAFYVGKLGLEHCFDFKNEQGERFGVYLKFGGKVFLELFQGAYEAEAEGSFMHLCLEVEDINAAVDQLRAAGLEVSDPVLGVDNTWQAWLADPDGNKLELHCYTPESWQAPFLGSE